MKQKLLTLLLLLLCVGQSWAIKYKVDSGDKTASVVYQSSSYDYDDGQPYSGDVVIPTTFEYQGQTYTVTSIGEAAFSDCSRLTSINIPEAVTSIGEYAFSGCSRLISINIPEAVTSIGEWAFFDCSRLTSINIPEAVTSIRVGTFSYCTGLTSINIPEAVTSIGEYAFTGCIYEA